MSTVHNSLLTKKGFASQNQVKWCPGCGDYAILNSLQSILAKVGAKKENTVIVSGIGCSGRLPYYMSTFGFHTLHGRAPAVATGLKLARPELSIWVVIGDGDGLSIGANQLFHLLRRNLNINVLLINNQIYGLTKGQFSPTSSKGKITATSPLGSIENPVNPILFALSAGASFVARAVDIDKENLEPILEQAYLHNGTAFIEILQNCHIFNNGSFEKIRNKEIRDESAVFLQHQKPLLFGKELKKAICADGFKINIKKFDNAEIPSTTIVHDNADLNLALSLSRLEDPVPLGIFRKEVKDIYENIFKTEVKNFQELINKFENKTVSEHC